VTLLCEWRAEHWGTAQNTQRQCSTYKGPLCTAPKTPFTLLTFFSGTLEHNFNPFTWIFCTAGQKYWIYLDTNIFRNKSNSCDSVISLVC